MSESTSQQRESWRAYECNQSQMTRIPFGPDEILVAPPTVDAWRALEAVLKEHQYDIRPSDTDSYNCRNIKGGSGKSLHSYGIALDVNWRTNPYKRTSDGRAVRFSNEATQAERARDVRAGRADTDMTRAMIDDVLAIRTNNGEQVFEWGGFWTTVKDAMHFEIDVTPDDLATGIDWETVRGRSVDFWGVGSWARGGQDMFGDRDSGNFEKAHALIEKWEGGFSHHRRDPGGATNMGITLQTLSEWRGRPVSVDEVRNLSRSEAQAIFRERYWGAVRGDELPLAVAQVVYNTAVLSGPRRAGSLLQEALNRQQLGVAVDGRIGTETIDACRRADQRQLVEDFCDSYEQYIRDRPHFGTFGRGWMNRLVEIRQTALGWVEESTSDDQFFDWEDLVPPPGSISFGDSGVPVEMLQKRLTELGYTLGRIDGRFGTLTREALLGFQMDNELTPTGEVDAATQAAFLVARMRQLSRERLMATAGDLRKRGSTTVRAADKARIAGIVATVLGALGIGNSFAFNINPTTEKIALLEEIRKRLPRGVRNAEDVKLFFENEPKITSNPLFDFLAGDGGGGMLAKGFAASMIPGLGGSLTALAVGLAASYFANNVIKLRVGDHRSGANIGR